MIRNDCSGLIVQRVLSAAVIIAVLSLAACAPAGAVPGTDAPTAVPVTVVPPTEGKAQAVPTDQGAPCSGTAPEDSFIYFKEEEGVVNRKTIITVPKQKGNPISISTLPLPMVEHPDHAKKNAKHPEDSKFGFWIISPEVCDTVKKRVLTEFENPLTITVILNDTDAPDGKFSLFVATQKDNTWNTQILSTTVTAAGNTMIATATITTTAPSDPVGGGFP